jgi:hypothetical protein
MYVLLTTGHFDRRVVKFTRAHPELKKPLAFSRPFDCIRSAENSKDFMP